MYTEKFEFEWDPVKARSNLEKHGISFEEAMTAFNDPWMFLAPDPAHSTESEVREWLIGESVAGLLVVVFTRRANGYRLISARKANARERRPYEAAKEASRRFSL
ncbi:MAG: BrnT family toxin [Bdellovibrionota bacterium]